MKSVLACTLVGSLGGLVLALAAPPSEAAAAGSALRASSGSRILCESVDRKRTRCDVRTRGGVRLVDQLSETRCREGRNWGYDGRGIWVDDGCRGVFEVGGRDERSRFVCESVDRKYRHCRADTRGGVRLVRQLSESRCREGRSWGVDRNGVWVDDGCRAEFERR